MKAKPAAALPQAPLLAAFRESEPDHVTSWDPSGSWDSNPWRAQLQDRSGRPERKRQDRCDQQRRRQK